MILHCTSTVQSTWYLLVYSECIPGRTVRSPIYSSVATILSGKIASLIARKHFKKINVEKKVG